MCPDCGLRIADCGLRTADCGLRIADCGLRTPYKVFKYSTRSRFCPSLSGSLNSVT